MSAAELAMVLLSALLHAVWNAYTKDTESPTAFLALIGFASLVLGAPVLWYVDFAAIPTEVWWLLALTVGFHSAYQVFLGRAYEKGDLSVVYPIARSTPAFVALIAIPLLHDPVSPIGAVGIAVVMLGMWLVHTNGAFRAKALVAPGIGYAYLTLLTTVGYSIFDKLAMKSLGSAPWSGPVPRALVYFYLLSLGYMALFGPYALATIPRATFVRVARARWGRLAFCLFGNVASYALILEALRTASVSYVTAVRQSSVVFAALLSMWMLKERPARPRILGALSTVVGVALIALYP